jgi:Tfp pilus assembly protein PilF
MKPSAQAPGSRKMLWIAGGVIILLILVGAAYVWYSISGLSPSPAVARAPAPRPLVAAPAPPPETPAASKAEASIQATPPPASKAPANERRERVPESTMPAASPALLQASRPAERSRIAPEVARGYAALRNGDLATARREYSAALATEPSNLDATLGLATVEGRSAKGEAAAALYRRALEVDPRNATAFAGLAALAEPGRAESLELQLLKEIARHPGSAALHFMLGNVYASQSLWVQAQASYFEAHRYDANNPDILHNLAVSLDRVGQPKVAATYYHRALESARTQATQFDTAAVTKRLGEIERAK